MGAKRPINTRWLSHILTKMSIQLDDAEQIRTNQQKRNSFFFHLSQMINEKFTINSQKFYNSRSRIGVLSCCALQDFPLCKAKLTYKKVSFLSHICFPLLLIFVVFTTPNFSFFMKILTICSKKIKMYWLALYYLV